MSKKRIIELTAAIALGSVLGTAYAQEKTLKDWGALNQDLAFEAKKKELNDLRQKNQMGAGSGAAIPLPSGSAPAAGGTGHTAGPVVLPVSPSRKPASADERPQLRLRAVMGVNDRVRGVFLRPTGDFVNCGVGCSVDGWVIAEMNHQGAMLRKGKKTQFVAIDPLLAPRMVEVEQGVPGGARNNVRSEPLPNPKIGAQQPQVQAQAQATQVNR